MMEGRWTIRECPTHGVHEAEATHCRRPDGYGDVCCYPLSEPVSVVPCDAAAMARALEAATTAIVESNDVILDGEEPADGWALKLAQRAIAAGFKAAGETP